MKDFLLKSILPTIAVTIILILLLVSAPAKSATFTNNGSVIYLEGDVEVGDSDKLKEMVQETGLTTLFLNSGGGNAIEGFRLGYTIDELSLQTIVASDASCLSSCAIAFLGGSSKVQGGLLGFHVAYAPDDTGTYSEGMKSGQFFGIATAIYLFNMGYTAQLYGLVAQMTDAETFLFISSDDLKLFTMVDNDFAHFEQLPKHWVSDRIAGPLRTQLLKRGI